MTNRVQRRLAEIEHALLSDASLADCLRKCVSLGGDLQSAPLHEWAQQELMGYGPDAQVPAYRIVAAPILSDGQVPGMTFTRKQVGIMELPDFARDDVEKLSTDFELRSGVGALIENARQADERGDGIVKMGLPLGADLARVMSTNRMRYESLYWAVSTSVVRGVLDQIRTTAVANLSELRAELPDDEPPAPEVANQAVNVVVHGGARNTVTVNTNRSHHGDAGTQPAAIIEPKGTRHQTVWTIVSVLVAIVGVYVAYRQWKG